MIIVDDIKQAREAWIKAVQARNVEDTVALYDPEKGILCGTVDTMETGPRVGQTAIRDYFEHFLANDKVVAEFPPDEKAQVVIYGNIALYTGYYTFKLTKDGVTRTANAKFTYVYKKGPDGAVKIIHHNSGLTPEGIQL